MIIPPEVTFRNLERSDAIEAAVLDRVSKLFPDRGYGFIEMPDGREVYFHGHCVHGHGFNRLSVGTQVRFVEEEGEQGPQASVVFIAGKG
ncbi:cold shock domain-containing protein [Sorangium sp. So ce448]|uniref:cold-shock protein n=1 Tax=Sorangium sp. So ce448 TaxID=3133314 RepID=UPI003F5EA1D8